MQFLLPAALIAGAYLVGSIPFSFLVVRLTSGTDLRNVGSGNVGATNVLRTRGKRAGLIALILDLAKGFAAVHIASVMVGLQAWPFPYEPGGGALHSPNFWIGLTALVAVIGHMYPVWLKFRGGKGVATAAGVFLAIDPWAIGIATVIFLAMVLGWRYVSLASMSAAAAIPLLMRFVTHQPLWTLIFSIIIALAVIIRHRSNIDRLARGTERKLGKANGDA
jgi:glycerol-3-phosphate acyltransferase PlsY